MAEKEKSAIPAPADMLKGADLSTPEKILSMMKDYAAGAIRGVTTDLAGTPVDIMNLLISPATKALGIYSEDPVGGSRDLRKRTGQPLEDSKTEMVGNLLTPGGAAHAMIVGATKIGKDVDAAMKIRDRVRQGMLESGKTIREAELAGNAMSFAKTGVYWDKGNINAKAVISDAATELNTNAFSQNGRSVGLNSQGSLGYVLPHNELAKAYPNTVTTRVSPSSSLSKGEASFDIMRDQINIGEMSSMEGTKGVLLHEVQHAIQHREKFTQGTNPTAQRTFTDNALQRLGQKHEELSMRKEWSEMSGQQFRESAEYDALQRYIGKAKLDDSRAFTKYMNNPGEQEARFTQQNQNLSQSELDKTVLNLLRQGKSPQSWDTQKLPDSL